MTPPLVSVVIAAYNAARYLPETLESVLHQTYPRVETILVDDGSTDDTPTAVRPFLPQIRYVRRPHQGLAAARNAGLDLAGGDFVALIDADDLWLPEKLARQVEIALRHPDSGLVVCDGVKFGGRAPDLKDPSGEGGREATGRLLTGEVARMVDGSPAGEITTDLHHVLLAQNRVACPAQTLIPRRVIERVGPFVDSDSQDYEYYLRIASQWRVTVHGHPLVRYRVHPGSMSGSASRSVRVWGFSTLALLRSHLRRCGPSERKIVAAHVARLVADLAYDVYARADEGRVARTLLLLRLLRHRPWPPTALPFLVGLWTPAFLRRPGRRGWHAVKRLMTGPGLPVPKARGP